ncbi:unnamed protein product [Rotaria socialis]|uniref:Uncharacterized protein n=1 Tax=Rotaria socialis TaxID=392032 RepID=A0A818G035_9BILA|nr:unnamed protein product [Rotaria socialis]CAF4886283.1 unnamed protein product [Rotaria socialis]
MADEQSNAKGEVQDPESGLDTGTQDTDVNSSQPNEGIDSNNSAQNTQLPQVEDIGSDSHESNDDDDNFVCSRKAYRALLKDRAQFEALKNQLKNEATAQTSQLKTINDLVKNCLNMPTDNNANIPDNDNDTVGTNNNGQSTSTVQTNIVQHLLPQNNIDISVRPRTYANVVRTSSPTNVANSQANILMRPNTKPIQPTVVSQQSVQSIPTQTFYSQLPQVQQTYNFATPNYNQGLNATPIYFVDRPAIHELPYFKPHTLEQFNKYLVSFERHCAKVFPDDREQWRTLLTHSLPSTHGVRFRDTYL